MQAIACCRYAYATMQHARILPLQYLINHSISGYKFFLPAVYIQAYLVWISIISTIVSFTNSDQSSNSHIGNSILYENVPLVRVYFSRGALLAVWWYFDYPLILILSLCRALTSLLVLINPANSISRQCSEHFLPKLLPHGDETDLHDAQDKLLLMRNSLLNMDGLGMSWYTDAASNYTKGISGP